MEELDLSQFREIFVSEAKEHLAVFNANLLELEKNLQNKELFNEIFRVAHTLKSMAATMGFEKITELTHSIEDLLDKVRSNKLEIKPEIVELLFDCIDTLELLLEEIADGEDRGINIKPLIEKLNQICLTEVTTASIATPKPDEIPHLVEKSEPELKPSTMAAGKTQTVRIKVEHLDKLINLVGELVISKARLLELAKKEDIPQLTGVINEISQYTTELQEEVLKTRMVPVRHIFDRYPRMVRDLSHKLGKEVEFVMSGTEIEVDRMLLDQINEPVVHLLRNAIDHGIEPPDVRKQLGKPPQGVLRLNARREKGYVWIEVSDDGKGLDPEEIKQKSIEKGIITQTEAQQLPSSEIFKLICHPEFSTAKEITDISGRGVGMDVVKNLVEAFNGRLEIISERGKGSTFVMHLPLTLAIIQALLVNVNKGKYAIPLSTISEIVALNSEDIKTIGKKEVTVLRNEVIPLVRLDKFFQIPEDQTSDYQTKQVVIVEVGGKRVGLIVSNVFGKQEIVIKTLTGVLTKVRGFSGATILGDGTVVLIIDVPALCENFGDAAVKV